MADQCAALRVTIPIYYYYSLSLSLSLSLPSLFILLSLSLFTYTRSRGRYGHRPRMHAHTRRFWGGSVRSTGRLQPGGNWCGVATVKTRPTHSSCRDSVGLLAPRYMDGFCQPVLVLSCSLPTHAAAHPRPLCLFSLRSCPPRYQPGETIYFTGLALRSTGVYAPSHSLFGHLREDEQTRSRALLLHLLNVGRCADPWSLRPPVKWILDRSANFDHAEFQPVPALLKGRKNLDRCTLWMLLESRGRLRWTRQDKV